MSEPTTPPTRSPLVRIELEYADGTLKRLTGADAEAFRQGLGEVLATAAAHDEPYRGPTFVTVREAAQPENRASVMCPNRPR